MIARKRQKPEPVRIGWREMVSLPAWGIEGLLVKADTGARGSALDVHEIHEEADGVLTFTVAVGRRGHPRTTPVRAAIVGRTRVRSSNGITQERFQVRTTVRIGAIERAVLFSLVNRRYMLCRALLGRRDLAGAFVVDPSRSYLLSSAPAKGVHVSP